MLPLKRRCVLCKSTNNNLHSFPKDENRKRAWVEAIGLRIQDIHSRDKLCDLHFTPNQYKSRASKRLREDASPSLLSFSALESEVNNEGILKKKRPRRCVLCRSTNSYLHEFPKDESRKREWVAAIGLRIQDIHSRDKLCDLHFTPNQYKNATSKRLKDDASPSLFLHATAEVKSMSANTNESNTFSEARTVASTSQFDLNDDAFPSSFVTCTITEVESLPEGTNESNSCSNIKTDTLNSQIVDQAFWNHESEEVPHVSTPTSNRASAKSEESQAFSQIPTKRYFRYFGDIREDDVRTSRRAVIALKMGQELVSQQRQHLKAARKRNSPLKYKGIKYIKVPKDPRSVHFMSSVSLFSG